MILCYVRFPLTRFPRLNKQYRQRCHQFKWTRLKMRLIWSCRSDSPAVFMGKLPNRMRLPTIVTLTRDVRSVIKTFSKAFWQVCRCESIEDWATHKCKQTNTEYVCWCPRKLQKMHGIGLSCREYVSSPISGFQCLIDEMLIWTKLVTYYWNIKNLKRSNTISAPGSVHLREVMCPNVDYKITIVSINTIFMSQCSSKQCS